jgi:hypothetical protein
MWNFKRDVFRISNDNGILVELCYDDITYSGACVDCGQILFEPFDSMVVRFTYNKPENGSDLDIMVYYDNTGTSQDGDAVGYGQLPNSLKTPSDLTPDGDAYLWWASDDVSSPIGPCVEAVVIGVENLINNVSIVGDIVDIPLRVGWFGGIGNGNIGIELVTYSGGTMYKSGTNILNSGGTAVDVQSTTANVTSVPGQVTEIHSNLVGTVQYNKLTKSAVLIT